MKNKIVSAMISLVVCISASFAGAKASPITFAYTTTGNNFHGSFTFDDSYLNGTAFQFIPHSTITAFTFTVPGKTFGLEDLVSASSFIFNSAGTTPDVVGAAGITAIKDGRQLWFGDTGIVLVSNPSHSNYRGDWNLVQSPEILTLTIEDTEGITVSEPGTLALFGLGLAGLGFARRRKAA